MQKRNPRKLFATVPMAMLPGEGGIGDAYEAEKLVGWAEKVGVHLQFLPLLKMNRKVPSPYSPASVFALDPKYLSFKKDRIDGLEDGDFDKEIVDTDGQTRSIRAIMRDLERLNHIDYERVDNTKTALLEHAFEHFCENDLKEGQFSRKGNAFNNFVAEHKWLKDYGIFCALQESYKDTPWEEWRPEHRSPETTEKWLRALKASAKPEDAELYHDVMARSHFHQFAQWQMDKQMKGLKKHAKARGVDIMLDVPCAVARNSVEIWGNQDLFNMDYRQGTYDDSKSHPLSRAFGFQDFDGAIPRLESPDTREWLVDRIVYQARYATCIRLDAAGSYGKNVGFRAEVLKNGATGIGELCKRSRVEIEREIGAPLIAEFRAHPHETDEIFRKVRMSLGDSTLIVAEDIFGTEPATKEAMHRHGILGFHLGQCRADEWTNDWPKNTIAIVSNHDTTPRITDWQMTYQAHEQGNEDATAKLKDMQAFASLGTATIHPNTPDTWQKLALGTTKAFAGAGSDVVAAWLPDLLGLQGGRHNYPGYPSDQYWPAEPGQAPQRPWRTKLPITVEELNDNRGPFAEFNSNLAQIVQASGRAPATKASPTKVSGRAFKPNKRLSLPTGHPTSIPSQNGAEESHKEPLHPTGPSIAA